MFGGQDDDAQAPQGGSSNDTSDNTLNGVSDLADGPSARDSGTPDGGFMPAPSEPAQASVPEPNEEAEDVARGDSSAGGSADNDELLDLKQQALQQLTPLVGHLDQSPLDKFRTTMMLIQASDNQGLLKEAYEAANKIEDEKIRAQALLDVINEINYFTQK